MHQPNFLFERMFSFENKIKCNKKPFTVQQDMSDAKITIFQDEMVVHGHLR